MQDWVKITGQRIILVFEGRDAAGKGGAIKAITERVSPRVFKIVALPAPSDREKSQMYIQRYMTHFPAARDQMLAATDTDFAPWHIVTSDDKKRARLNLIAHLLKQIPYEHMPQKKVKLSKRNMKLAYDDEASMINRRWVTEIY